MDSYSAICGMPTSTLNTPSCPTYGAQIKSRAVFLSMEKSCAYERTYTVFMIVAQKSRTVAQRTFWIDAICIDQGSTLEKNHQVAKMGLIYTKAQEVVAWLGFSRAISRALAFCTASTSQNYETVGEAREFWDRLWNRNLIYDWHEFQRHPYWIRAWITQEIFCARRIVVLVNESEFDLSECPFLRLLLPGINQNGGEWDTAKVFDTYLQVMCGKTTFKQRRLIDLFHDLPRRESQIPRDRIYSLFSLASDVSLVSVDYDTTDNHLIRQILDVFGDSLCFCSWMQLANALEYATQPRPNKHEELVFRFGFVLAQDEFIPEFNDHRCPSCNGQLGGFHEHDVILLCIEKEVCPSFKNVHFTLKVTVARFALACVTPSKG
jgi:hypothetical protein